MSLRPALVDPQGGPITGKRGGPMLLAKPAGTWSHVAGKRQESGNQEDQFLSTQVLPIVAPTC